MAGPKLAKTVAANGPDDKLIVVDVYTEDGSEVANSYQDTHPEAIDVLDGAGGGGSDGLKSDATPEISGGFDGVDVDSPNNDISDLAENFAEVPASDIADWLSGGNYEIASDINDLSDKLKESFRSALKGADEVYADLNGVVTKLQPGIDPRSMGAMTGLVNKLGCGNYNPNILYRGGNVSLISSLINAASRIGLPGVFNAIANCVTDPNVIGGVLRNVLPNVASQANIPLLNDIGNSKLAKDVIGVMPGIIGQTVGNLGRPNYLQQSQYAGYYGQARQSFGNIDPYWNTTTRGDYGRSLDATIVNRNSFFNQTLQASVLSTPMQVLVNTVTGDGNAAKVNYGISTYPIQRYENETDQTYRARVEKERFNDTMISVASTLAARQVSDVLRSTFPEVNARVNRSVRMY